MKKSKKLAVLGLSGGVDSAVSAYLLQQSGYEVIGIFMQNWDPIINGDFQGHKKLTTSGCSAIADFQDAQAVAEKLQIKLIKVNFVQKYWDDVFQKTLNEFKQGLTPNPDILCNQFIKFGTMLQYVKRHYPNAKFATGHYAKLVNLDNRYLLQIPIDTNKDQTYFLCNLNKTQLKDCLFPLADLNKTEVRQIAQHLNLIVAYKKDSTGICFIGERKFKLFLENYFQKKPGKMILYPQKKVIGKHDGLMFYTIGQRKGLAVNHPLNEPIFVFRKNKSKNELHVVGKSFQDQYLISKQATIKNFNWIYDDHLKPKINEKVLVRFRHRQPLIESYIKKYGKDTVVLCYPSGSKAVTPGQYAVLYSQEKICLGGGRIITTKK